jgi:hypothetical protein
MVGQGEIEGLRITGDYIHPPEGCKCYYDYTKVGLTRWIHSECTYENHPDTPAFKMKTSLVCEGGVCPLPKHIGGEL